MLMKRTLFCCIKIKTACLLIGIVDFLLIYLFSSSYQTSYERPSKFISNVTDNEIFKREYSHFSFYSFFFK